MSPAGKKTVKLEVRSGRKSSSTNLKSNKRSRSSGLEFKLDELRKELASLDGGIFPHSVLSTQQISMLSEKKPKSMEEVKTANYYVSHAFTQDTLSTCSSKMLLLTVFSSVHFVDGEDHRKGEG